MKIEIYDLFNIGLGGTFFWMNPDGDFLGYLF